MQAAGGLRAAALTATVGGWKKAGFSKRRWGGSWMYPLPTVATWHRARERQHEACKWVPTDRRVPKPRNKKAACMLGRESTRTEPRVRHTSTDHALRRVPRLALSRMPHSQRHGIYTLYIKAPHLDRHCGLIDAILLRDDFPVRHLAAVSFYSPPPYAVPMLEGR